MQMRFLDQPNNKKLDSSSLFPKRGRLCSTEPRKENTNEKNIETKGTAGRRISHGRSGV